MEMIKTKTFISVVQTFLSSTLAYPTVYLTCSFDCLSLHETSIAELNFSQTLSLHLSFPSY